MSDAKKGIAILLGLGKKPQAEEDGSDDMNAEGDGDDDHADGGEDLRTMYDEFATAMKNGDHDEAFEALKAFCESCR